MVRVRPMPLELEHRRSPHAPQRAPRRGGAQGPTRRVRRRSRAWPSICYPPTGQSLSPEVSMFGVIGWIVFGLVVGAIAKLLMPGRDPGGFIITMLLGIAGALLGGFLGRAMGWYREGEAAGFLMSLIGAVVLLVIYRMAIGNRARV